jgi:hypothetical protein
MTIDLRRHRAYLLVGAGVMVGATLAHTQALDVKLGLWEVTTTSNSTGAPPVDFDKLNLTPEQRARAEAALKASQSASQRPRVQKYCVTKEKLDNVSLFQDSQESAKNCKQTVVSSSRTVRDLKFECAGDRQTTGEVRFDVLASDSVKASVKMNVILPAGPMTVNSASMAKWVSADCGSVK